MIFFKKRNYYIDLEGNRVDIFTIMKNERFVIRDWHKNCIIMSKGITINQVVRRSA